MTFFKWFKGLFCKKEEKQNDNTPSKSALLYDVAMGEFGTKEVPGKQHNKKILEYHKTTGHFSSDEVPWCASFCNWVCRQLDLEETGSAMARSFLSWGKKVDLSEWEKGDIVIFWRKKKNSPYGHVGFVHDVDHSKGLISVLGGNQDNTVKIKDYSMKQFLEIRRAN